MFSVLTEILFYLIKNQTEKMLKGQGKKGQELSHLITFK